MSEHLQREIESLKKEILTVATLVEESLRDSVRAFLKRDATLAKKVIDGDAKIDEKEVEVEEECLKILALHQPVAVDLRYIVSVLKINNDLERIGDLASNIAERAKFLSKRVPIEVPESIPEMSEIVQAMLEEGLDALVKMDVSKADSVLERDEEVDNLHAEIYPLVQSKIEADPDKISEWIQLLGVSRYLERAADHTTNIAEDIIYMVEGKISRHTNA